MRQLSVASLMTSEVITASPDTPFKDLALLMEEHGISAVPVVEGDYAVGVVSEADLLAKEEFRGGTTARPRFCRAGRRSGAGGAPTEEPRVR